MAIKLKVIKQGKNEFVKDENRRGKIMILEN